MGWGHFSTVWLAFNIKDKKLYALKIMRGHTRYLRTAYDEEAINRIVAENHDNPSWIESLKKRGLSLAGDMRDHTHCMQMYDWFFHHGPHGRHFTMCFEVLGKNLLNLINKYQHRGIPIPLVREITRQLLLSLDYLHRVCKLIHTDLKPENVTFSMSQEEEFELLYRHVFMSKELLQIYEQKEDLISSGMK
jgi:serine/threonine-protein kinase SRPK3